jgi:transposase
LTGKTQDTTDAATTGEIEAVLKKLKNNNSFIIKTLPDIIPAELLKFSGDTLKQWLKHIFSSIWLNEQIPVEWLKGILCPLHKKGDQL